MPSEIEKLKEEIAVLKKEAADQEWGIKKTNEGIKLLYKELEKKNKQLEQLDRLKSEFVSTVSHELRTPMAIIKESLSQILEGLMGDVPDGQKKLLNMALNNVNRLSRIINNLLDISKIESGQIEISREKFNLVDVIDEVVESFFQKASAKSIALKRDVPAQDIPVNADRDKIIQVFTNLIGNALKFTQHGSVTISAKLNDGLVECSVADTGTGISSEDLPKVFGKFQQFTRVEGPGDKGTGLGLAISKGIVELHQGNIWVESKVNEGTKFSFTIPQ